jgi:hypothetical protein
MQNLKILVLTEDQLEVILKMADLAGDMWAEAAADLKGNPRSDVEDLVVGIQCEEDLKVLDGLVATVRTAQENTVAEA